MHDHLERWEKWPIWLLMGANGVMIFHWFTIEYLPPWLAGLLGLLYTLGGFAAALAIDGAMVATTMGRRAGRNGAWSTLSALVATAFGGAVALDLHGALEIGAWIHAGFALLIFCYLQHLAQLRRTLAAEHRTHAAEDAPIVATVRDYVRIRALAMLQEDPTLSMPMIARRLETSADTVRRAMGAARLPDPDLEDDDRALPDEVRS